MMRSDFPINHYVGDRRDTYRYTDRCIDICEEYKMLVGEPKPPTPYFIQAGILVSSVFWNLFRTSVVAFFSYPLLPTL